VNRVVKGIGFPVLAAVALTTQVSSEPSERSVYQLDSKWVEDNGRGLRLGALEGNMQLLALIYTTCEGSCPITVKAMQMFSTHMPDDIKDRIRFLLVTVDPEKDTLPVLRQYRRDMKLDRHWKLLRGSAEDVRELAAVLGFNYEQIESGQFAHSNLVTVLDARGEIVHQQNDFASNAKPVIEAIRQQQGQSEGGQPAQR
jgi:protein SCO1/2